MWSRQGILLLIVFFRTALINAWIPASLRSSSSTLLEARRAKGKSLETLAKEGLVDPSPIDRPKRKTSSSSSKKTSKPIKQAPISAALAEWMANNQGKDYDPLEIGATSFDTSTTTSTFQSFDDETKPKNERRMKQSQRTQEEEARQAQVAIAVTALEEALEGNNNLEEILNAVRGLLSLPVSPSASPRLLLGGKQRYDYRLAWVGSDEAICHIGTGLHKVPLARLQEVFWSCLGKNRMQVLEIIRILGPFPNVRNTLEGTTKLLKGDTVPTLNIVMDSMIDGTGKEILAGTADNIRRVNLQLHFADERVMVAVVPTTDGEERVDPLEKNGSNVLVFLREENLDEKLDALRVS